MNQLPLHSCTMPGVEPSVVRLEEICVINMMLFLQMSCVCSDRLDEIIAYTMALQCQVLQSRITLFLFLPSEYFRNRLDLTSSYHILAIES